MNDTKPWWQSKTIITSLVGAIFALLAVFGKLPAGVDSEQAIGAILAVTSILAAFFRVGAKATIGTAA